MPLFLFLTAADGKLLVQHGDFGEVWVDDLYHHGFLPKHKLRRLWEFNEEAIRITQALGRGDGVETLAEALIKVLMQLDLVFEHSGLLGDGDSGDPSQEQYLVPEVWSERWESPAG